MDAPPSAEVWRRMERNRQKLVGRDEGSLTEQQTKGTVTITIQIRGKHNTNPTTQTAALLDRTDAACSRAASEFPPPCSPPTGTQHDSKWYGILFSVWPGRVSPPGCVSSWLLVKSNPVRAEPRTVVPHILINSHYSKCSLEINMTVEFTHASKMSFN